ncbi:hypothetical protein MKX03_012204 [Papaver bracteatum]|nr:hypothetical protein MKX03_030802 [Papaver bracteatum]KAI3884142.1 hypothetical protein MKX03_012204 [Papaver bracteatum]
MDMLSPVIGRIATEVAAVANAGYGEVNPPHDEPEPAPEPEPTQPNPTEVNL